MAKNETRFELKELESFCEGRLAKYKWPKELIFCDDFPRTALGKVRKVMLCEPPKGPGD